MPSMVADPRMAPCTIADGTLAAMAGMALALVGTAVAVLFVVRLSVQWRERRRHHALAWALSLGCYALGMLVLAAAFLAGWSASAYGVYWLTGALVNVPLLAVGELLLLRPDQRTLWWVVAAAAVAWAVGATLVSGFDTQALAAATAEGGIPVGADVLAGQPAYAALQPLTLTGTVVVLAGTIWSAVRQRRPAILLIAVGVVVAASSSVFVRNDVDAMVPVALAGGVTVMYAGFRAATTRPRRTPATSERRGRSG